MRCGVLTIDCGNEDFSPAAGADTPVSIRPTDIELIPVPASPGANEFVAKVLRQTYLGKPARLSAGAGTRADPGNNAAASSGGSGGAVGIRLPPAQCRALPC